MPVSGRLQSRRLWRAESWDQERPRPKRLASVGCRSTVCRCGDDALPALAAGMDSGMSLERAMVQLSSENRIGERDLFRILTRTSEDECVVFLDGSGGRFAARGATLEEAVGHLMVRHAKAMGIQIKAISGVR